MEYLTSKKIKPKATKQKGFVLYDGPSVLDGQPIVVIATMETSNRKTGNMVQTWILRSDISPTDAAKIGLDSSICGNCPQRWFRGGACYVNIGHAPLAIYKAYKRGLYPAFNPVLHSDYITGRKVRLGAYGDPAAAPFKVMDSIAKMGISWTGYTHQIKHRAFDTRFIDLCMVSADSPKQAIKYQSMGARTFRVAMEGDALAKNEVECLADSKGIQCSDCMLCDGASKTSKNVALTVHGSRKSKFKTNLIKTLQVA